MKACLVEPKQHDRPDSDQSEQSRHRHRADVTRRGRMSLGTNRIADPGGKRTRAINNPVLPETRLVEH